MKKGLGKGLGALLGVYDIQEPLNMDVKPKETTSQNNENIQAKTRAEQSQIDTMNKLSGGVEEIDITLIDANPNQPRKKFDIEALQELANSIKQHGVIQPIVLNKVGDRYMIIAGERRYRASKLAGKMDIPAIVKNYSDSKVKEISIIENLQREDLNAIEAARAIKELMVEYKLTQEAVADRIGKSRPAVANLLRLLTLSPTVISLIEEDRLSQGHAKCLIALPNYELQNKLAAMASDNKMSVRDLEKTIKDILEPKQVEKKQKQEHSLELKELVTKMTRKFATKVSVIGNDNKGRIYIDYFNKDDLERINSLIESLN